MSRSGGTVAIPAPDFNLALTLESGQVFHWTAEDQGYAGVIEETPVFVKQQGDSLIVTRGKEELVKHYFALDHPLSEIYATFPSDPAMAEALQFCRGLRIVRQPPWECLATFITSALKQVPHIKQISHCLRERFGKRIAFEGRDLFAYPAPERIASLTETDLRDCKLGFRAKNLLGTARMIASGEVQLERVASMPDHAALAELCRLPGVGPKIANCVLLFAYGRLKAFPIDVWIERVLREIYFKRKRKVTARRLLEFSQTYFGAFGGYAQQYLFHHARKTWRLRK